MNIRYRPHVYIPEDEEQTSKHAGSKAGNIELSKVTQNDIQEMSEEERYEESRKHEQLDKKCESQESHNKQFNDEDRKALRLKEKEKLAQQIDDQNKRLTSLDDGTTKKKKSKKKRRYIDDDDDDELIFSKIKKKRSSPRRIANKRIQKEASLLKG